MYIEASQCSKSVCNKVANCTVQHMHNKRQSNTSSLAYKHDDRANRQESIKINNFDLFGTRHAL